VKEIDLIEYIKNNLSSIFAPVSFVQLTSIQSERNEQGFEVDLITEVLINKKKRTRLMFEIKSAGQPRFARLAAMQLKNYINQNKNCYGIFAAPFISDESKQICRDNNIGFMDLAGNYLFSFDNIYLNREGQGNPYPSNRPIKSIFSTKSTRILRVLLCNPKKEWYLQDLAKEAEISIGQASNIKQQLLDFEWLTEKLVGRKFKLVMTKPDMLLQKWSENYSFTRNKSRNFYALDDITTLENKVMEYFQKNQSSYAFTLTSGASRVAPFLRYSRIYFYMQGDIESMIQDLRWKEVDTGPNITILKPYDEGIFYQTQEINHAKIVSNIQLYLDLQTLEARGKEAAQYLLEQKLRKEW
jgi:hypothetical protein